MIARTKKSTLPVRVEPASTRVVETGSITLAPPPVTLAIDASNDREAIAVWLDVKARRSKNTLESYTREAARLLLWLEEQGMGLRDMKVEDAHAYYEHLRRPPAHWIRPRKAKPDRVLHRTRVLPGPLGAKSINHARTVLSLMCAYLRDAGYLAVNVFRLSQIQAVPVETHTNRYFDLETWHWLRRWLEDRHANKGAELRSAARDRWLLNLLYHTGLRREEAATGAMGDFRRHDGIWKLRTLGKGRKERLVTVDSTLLDELIRYRRALGLPDFPSPKEAHPLVASIHPTRVDQPLSLRTIWRTVSRLCKAAANHCEDAQIRGSLMSVSTHWLRHTNATHRLAAGASLETTQDELGHADPRTTRIYAKIVDKRRVEDAEKLARYAAGQK